MRSAGTRSRGTWVASFGRAPLARADACRISNGERVFERLLHGILERTQGRLHMCRRIESHTLCRHRFELHGCEAQPIAFADCERPASGRFAIALSGHEPIVRLAPLVECRAVLD